GRGRRARLVQAPPAGPLGARAAARAAARLQPLPPAPAPAAPAPGRAAAGGGRQSRPALGGTRGTARPRPARPDPQAHRTLKMPRTVYCQYEKRETEGLDFVPWPGELGRRIHAHIGKNAWNAWLA